jgi:hypothetical protein
MQSPIRSHVLRAFFRENRCRDIRCTVLPRGVFLAALFVLCSGVLWAQKSSEPLLAQNETTAASDTRQQFHVGLPACNTCHSDPHEFGPAPKLSCEACHEPKQWGTLLPFDHTRASSKLEGAHKEMASALPCDQCHKPSEKGVPLFSAESIQCTGCHGDQEPHGGQFKTSGVGTKDCSSCHIPKSWATRTFDHSHSRFSLTAAHRDVSCTKCHKEQKVANGQSVRLFRGTPDDCLKCH